MTTPTSAAFSKRVLARLLDTGALLRADLATRRRSTVLVVNYHGTPAALASNLARQLLFYRAHFECLVEDDLLGFLNGAVRLRRPGIVICFDDGLRNHAEVAAPLLEAHGLRGWFMVPGAFLDQDATAQPAYFSRHIRPRADVEHPSAAAPSAMSWESARGLCERGHVVACHTWSHRTLGASASAEIIREEVPLAKRRLQERLGRPVRSFGWVRGEVRDYSANAHRAIASCFDLAFTSMAGAVRPGDDPLRVHRFNVEASFPLSVIRFQISRWNEAWFARRRRAADSILAGPVSGKNSARTSTEQNDLDGV